MTKEMSASKRPHSAIFPVGRRNDMVSTSCNLGDLPKVSHNFNCASDRGLLLGDETFPLSTSNVILSSDNRHLRYFPGINP